MHESHTATASRDGNVINLYALSKYIKHILNTEFYCLALTFRTLMLVCSLLSFMISLLPMYKCECSRMFHQFPVNGPLVMAVERTRYQSNHTILRLIYQFNRFILKVIFINMCAVCGQWPNPDHTQYHLNGNRS